VLDQGISDITVASSVLKPPNIPLSLSQYAHVDGSDISYGFTGKRDNSGSTPATIYAVLSILSS
jgi:hypothetical protein